MKTTFAILALAAATAVLPEPASAELYRARFKVTKGDAPVTDGTISLGYGEPLKLAVSERRRYGGADGAVIDTGFTFEMSPRRSGEGMRVEVRLAGTEVTDERTGAVREEASVLQGEARREGDGWAYESDALPGGKAIKVTFREVAPAE